MRSARAYKTVFVPTWVIPPHQRGLGMIDARKGGLTRVLSAMNLRLMTGLEAESGIFVLNTDPPRLSFTARGTRSCPSPGTWAKSGSTPTCSVPQRRTSKRRLPGFRAAHVSCSCTDLDDTLWGGIVGR